MHSLHDELQSDPGGGGGAYEEKHETKNEMRQNETQHRIK